MSQLWHVDQTSEERNIAYLSTLAKHTQAVNVVRWCPRGTFAPRNTSCPPVLTRPQSTRNSLRVPATMVMSCCGFAPTSNHTVMHSAPKLNKTRRHGSSSACAAQTLVQRLMILHGLPMAHSSSREAWTMSPAYSMPRVVSQSMLNLCLCLFGYCLMTTFRHHHSPNRRA